MASQDEISIVTLVVSDVSAELSATLDEQEETFQNDLEQQGREGEGWAARFHCAAQGYLPRPRLYGKGQGSYLCYALHNEKCVGSYVLSTRDVWFQQEKLSLCYGYLARVSPAYRGKGLNLRFYAETTDYAKQRHDFALGVIARDNHASLKGQIRTNVMTGYDFFGEQTLYVLPTAGGIPSSPVDGAVAEVIADHAAADELFERIYGKDGLRLVSSNDVMELPQHAGHHVLRKGTSAAGVSLWRPDYAWLLAPGAAEQSRYTLFYNLWTEGEEGSALIAQLLSTLLTAETNPHAILILLRNQPSSTTRAHSLEGIPTYDFNPLEDLIRPHALGFEEEIVLGGYLSFSKDKRRLSLPVTPLSYDPRDISSLLCFHPLH